MKLPAEELALLYHLNRNGLNRYREISTYTKGDELGTCDSLVWHLRRFCQAFRVTLRLRDGSRKDLFELNVERVNHPDFLTRPYRFKLIGGYLEKVLAAPRHDLRRINLVWGNAHFGPGRAPRMWRSHSANAFLSRYPEEIDCLRDFIHLPKGQLASIEQAKAASQKEANARKKF